MIDHLPGLQGKKYGCIYADPPWTFKRYSHATVERSPEAHYNIMSLDDIKQLPVAEHAAADCVLLLWACDPLLRQAFEVIDAWGFEFKTVGFYWTKLNKSGNGLFTGLGYWTRCLTGDTAITILEDGVVRQTTMAALEGVPCENYLIWSHDGWKKVYDFVKREATDVAVIDTRIGQSRSSWDHKWAHKRLRSPRRDDGKRRREHVVEYATLEDIEKLRNMSVAQSGNSSVNFVFSTTPIERPDPITTHLDFDLTTELGWLLGLYCAEGNMASNSNQNQIRFTLHKKETHFVERISALLRALDLDQDRYFNYKVEANLHHCKNSEACHVYFSSIRLKQFIHEFILPGNAYDRRLNLDLLLQTPISFRRAVLHGMLDGDGTKGSYGYNGFTKLVLCNENLIEDFRTLAHSLGVMTSRYYPAPAAASNGTICQAYAFRFVSPRNKSLELDGHRVTPIEIKSINSGGQETTYDIWVEDHAFVANWMISHNCNPEQCLLATRGHPKRKSKSVKKLIQTPRREHSRKPDEGIERIEQLLDGPYLEMFARQSRPGWDSFGNETAKFDPHQFPNHVEWFADPVI